MFFTLYDAISFGMHVLASGPHTALYIPDPALSSPEFPAATLSLPLVLASMLPVKVLTATIDTNIATTATATIALIWIHKMIRMHDLKTS